MSIADEIEAARSYKSSTPFFDLPSSGRASSGMAAGPIVNAVLLGGPMSVFSGLLNNPSFARVLNPAASSGDVDLYTCPAGRRAFVGGAHALNTAGTSTSWFPEIKIGSTYYRVGSTSSPGAGLGTTVPAYELCLEAGDKFALNISQPGLNFFAQIIEFDAASALTSARLVAPNTGDNVLYTVPAGKSAMVPLFVYALSDGGTAAGVNPCFVADAGGTRNITWYHIPSGGSKGTATQSRASAAVSPSNPSSSGAAPAPVTMGAGDQLLLNVDVGNAAQFCWATIIEIS